MTAEEIAKTAGSLVGGKREQTHGDKRVNFDNIAILWNAWLEMRFGAAGLAENLTGSDVAKLMALLKMARMESGEFNDDDFFDSVGYLCIAGELSAPLSIGKAVNCRHGTTMGHCVLCDGDDDLAVTRR